MDKNVRKCVLIAGAFAALSVGNVQQVWASGANASEVMQQAKTLVSR